MLDRISPTPMEGQSPQNAVSETQAARIISLVTGSDTSQFSVGLSTRSITRNSLDRFALLILDQVS